MIVSESSAKFELSDLRMESGMSNVDPDFMESLTKSLQLEKINEVEVSDTVGIRMSFVNPAQFTPALYTTAKPDDEARAYFSAFARAVIRKAFTGADIIRFLQADEVSNVQDSVSTRIRGKLEKVISNTKMIDEMHAVAVGQQAGNAQDALRHQIRYVETVRSQSENPDRKQALLHLFRRMLTKVFNVRDLDVELLSTEDAFIYGARGRFVPASGESRAKICIPISKYGTTRMLSLEEITDIFVDLLAYYCLATSYIRKMQPCDEGYDQHITYRHVLGQFVWEMPMYDCKELYVLCPFPWSGNSEWGLALIDACCLESTAAQRDIEKIAKWLGSSELRELIKERIRQRIPVSNASEQHVMVRQA